MVDGSCGQKCYPAAGKIPQEKNKKTPGRFGCRRAGRLFARLFNFRDLCASRASAPGALAQPVVPNFSSPPALQKAGASKGFDFIGFFAVGRAGMPQAGWQASDTTKHLTKGTNHETDAISTPRTGLPAFGRLTSLQDELDRLFEAPMTAWAPALDVHEDKDSFSVCVELPGLKREDIEVSLHDGALVITGERKEEKISEGTEVHRQERYYGKFSRALTLPAAVAGDRVKAQYKDGILTVTLPKAEEAKPKAIAVGG